MFCERNGIKMLDDVKKVLEVTDRINFNRKMQNLLDKQSQEIRDKF